MADSKQAVSSTSINRYLRKIRLESNSILVVRSGCALTDGETMQALIKEIEKLQLTNVLIVVSDNLYDINTFSKDVLQRAGWHYAPGLEKLKERLKAKADEDSKADQSQPG